MPVPFAVHLVFHPGSVEGRAIAERIDASLNDDPAVPGLTIPTRIVPEDGSGRPPVRPVLDDADHSVVVLLADGLLALEDDNTPSGRIDWPEFAARLHAACDDKRHRFIAIQLSAAAYGFHAALANTSFAKAFEQPAEVRPDWVARRVLIELNRFCVGLSAGDRAPVQLFLSHSRGDIKREPEAFSAIAAHLDATQPVKAWVDSAEIEAGSSFVDRIKSGVTDSALLVVLTTSYSSRPWCRREVLLAKEHHRPVVVVDALAELDRRAFPYLGNVPVLNWATGGAAAAVDLLLKEALRHAHARRCLARQAEPGDIVFGSPPELLTVTRAPAGATILYPEPPVDDEEQRLLDAAGRKTT